MTGQSKEREDPDLPDKKFLCAVDFALDDHPWALRAFLLRVQPLLVAPRTSCWELDLRRCRYMGPDAAALILSTVLAGRYLGQTCTVTLPESPKELAAFCHFSGLNHHLLGQPAPEPGHLDSETVPLEVHRTTDWFCTSVPFVRLIRRHVDMSEDAEEYLRICINESLQNVEDHARSPIGAVTCARYIAGYCHIRLAVVDRGLGILTTLRQRHPDTRDASEALRRVVEGGYSSMSRPSNQGVGISNLAMIVKQMGGTVNILSGNAMAVFDHGRWTFSQDEYEFPGTGLFLTLPVVDRV